MDSLSVEKDNQQLFKPTNTKLIQYTSDIERIRNGKQSKNLLEFENSPVIISLRQLYTVIWVEHYGTIAINFEPHTLNGHYLIFLCPQETMQIITYNLLKIITIPDSLAHLNENAFIKTFGNIEKKMRLNKTTLSKTKQLFNEFQFNEPRKTFQKPTVVLNGLLDILSINQQKKAQEFGTRNFMLASNFIYLVNKHYKMDHEISFYAKTLSISPKKLCEKFYSLGINPPHKYIKYRLISEAKRQLLYSKKSIKTICYDIGFNDSAYFSRFFKKNTGITARSFRASNTNFSA